MAKLIENNTRGPEEGSRPPLLDIILIPVEEPPNLRSRVPPKPSLALPVSSALIDPVLPADIVEFGVSLPRPELSLEGVFEGHLHGFNQTDGDARILMMIEPKYPMKAFRQHISGYVIAQFDVEVDGTTSNIKIQQAIPSDIFNEEAIRAIQKWKYRPKVEDGIAMKQAGLRVRLDFHANKPN